MKLAQKIMCSAPSVDAFIDGKGRSSHQPLKGHGHSDKDDIFKDLPKLSDKKKSPKGNSFDDIDDIEDLEDLESFMGTGNSTKSDAKSDKKDEVKNKSMGSFSNSIFYISLILILAI